MEIATQESHLSRAVWELRELTHITKTEAMMPCRRTWSNFCLPYPLGRCPSYLFHIIVDHPRSTYT